MAQGVATQSRATPGHSVQLNPFLGGAPGPVTGGAQAGLHIGPSPLPPGTSMFDLPSLQLKGPASEAGKYVEKPRFVLPQTHMCLETWLGAFSAPIQHDLHHVQCLSRAVG
eukprot:CAMPEP_0174366918 /NCGR_PEP_ID=MMETSP0811_2-20130205/83123_1 /TAXON_ID=73025 ORGANISM="Eutreptiella gymnastica-like, Strain CCMP1594" /NCGR_SAMPLE_ID=MMETSP0811_2 /ASSEMBLY_ACC=CAM_ASM_000667 /LENGTH=110 /DNA_ID=CAMNT_0015508949 /DNA_START=202 /DNA_END=532 /DNA_ORIENTATION=+